MYRGPRHYGVACRECQIQRRKCVDSMNPAGCKRCRNENRTCYENFQIIEKNRNDHVSGNTTSNGVFRSVDFLESMKRFKSHLSHPNSDAIDTIDYITNIVANFEGVSSESINSKEQCKRFMVFHLTKLVRYIYEKRDHEVWALAKHCTKTNQALYKFATSI